MATSRLYVGKVSDGVPPRSACYEDEVSGGEMISTSATVISCGLYEKELSERHALRRQKKSL